MFKLPNETLHQIVGYLELETREDIHNLRLTCRRAAAVGFEHILPVLNITISEKGFDRLNKVAADPTLSKSLRELWLHPDILIEHQTFIDWCRTLGHGRREITVNCFRTGTPRNGLADTFPFLNRRQHLEAWQQYRAYVNQQDRILEPGVLEEAMRTTVSRFSGLQVLGMSSLCQEMIDGSIGYDASGAFPFSLNGNTFTLLRQVAETGYQEPSARMLSSALDSLHPGVRLVKLNVGGLLWDQLCTDDWVDRILRLLPGMRCPSITDPELAPYRNRSHDLASRQSLAMHNGAIPRVVREAKDLAELQLWMPWAAVDINDAMTIETLFDQTSCWTKLRKLDLLNMLIEETSLLDFLSRHKHCLKELILQMPFLDGADPSWVDLRKNIKRTVDLESFGVVDDEELDKSMGLVDPELEVHPDVMHWRYLPNKLSIARALRYLVCGQRTNPEGQIDIVARYSDNVWAKVTWLSVEMAL